MMPYFQNQNLLPQEEEKNIDYVISHCARASAYPNKQTLHKWLADSVQNYDESELARKEIPLYVRAGSCVLISSECMHRSVDNRSDTPRRAWMPQFSAAPILQHSSSNLRSPIAHAIPLFERK